MKKADKINEIISNFTSFQRDSYTKNEFLPELMLLQNEICNLTPYYNQESTVNFRITDVEKLLREINDKRDNIADNELNRFSRSCKIISNRIKSEISGCVGEKKLITELSKMQYENRILTNVELEYDGKRVEIDAIVFVNNGIFIVEVKNSKKNIFIDDKGGLYRIGRSMHYDGNIAEKMQERERFLRRALECTGIEDIKIYNILAFSNPYIDVENKYPYIKVCGCNYLPVYIDKFKSKYWYSAERISIMVEAVNEAMCKSSYQMSINMDEFKYDFADLIATLEGYEDTEEETVKAGQAIKDDNSDDKEDVSSQKKFEIKSYIKDFAVAAAGFVATNVAIWGIGKFFKK